MKKSAVLATAIIVAAAAYTGASWYVGMQAEKTIRTAVDQANARIVKALGQPLAASGAVVEINEYRRGLFSSDVRYTLLVEDGDEQLHLGLADHMNHGPFPWSLIKEGTFTPLLAHSRSQLVDTESVKRWFDAARGTTPLKGDTRIHFGGDGVSEWVFAPLEWAAEDDRLSFSGGRLQVRFSNDFRDNEGEGQFDSIMMVTGPEADTLTLREIKLLSKTTTADDDTVQVHSTLEAASLAVEDAADDVLVAEGLTITLDSKQKGELLDGALRYDVKSARLGEIGLGSISVGGKTERLNVAAFSAVLTEYDAIATEHGADEGEEFDLTPQDRARLLKKVLPALASSPVVALDPVVWRNDKGESTLMLSAAFRPIKGDPANQDEALLAEALSEMRLDLVLSRPMFLQAFAQTGGADEREQLEMLAALMFDRYVSELEQGGLVRRDGDQAIINVVYAEDAVNVNGQSMSVEEFLMRFAGFLM